MNVAFFPRSGSSPLARGLPGAEYPDGGDRGIIPARAGFTTWGRGYGRASRDHPRSRGVYWAASSSGRTPAGSSPLARGLRPGVVAGGGDAGIIPARAGFTRPPSRGGRPPPDHPRSRGVYDGRRNPRPHPQGSSPLARGLPCRIPARRPAMRIIPARAGFTGPDHLSRPGQADHPRSRGVYSGDWVVNAPDGGSSPLARGLRPGLLGRLPGGRIIPARAGFTIPVTVTVEPNSGSSPLARGLHSSPAGNCAWSADHPRSRGVYPRYSLLDDDEAGSSPLARGLHWLVMWVPHATGIIPARAGFTRDPQCPEDAARDHPRSRGVYKVLRATAGRLGGSSPLARGLRPAGRRLPGAPGIIPARAGFTKKSA